MLSISRSLQDHFGAKISSKSKFEPNGDVRSTYVLSRGERVKKNVKNNALFLSYSGTRFLSTEN